MSEENTSVEASSSTAAESHSGSSTESNSEFTQGLNKLVQQLTGVFSSSKKEDRDSSVSSTESTQSGGASQSKAARALGTLYPTSGYLDDFWDAQLTERSPYPVILVHGTIANKNNWQQLAELLRSNGFVVFGPDYGERATKHIPESAKQLNAYINLVLQVTGADKVDIVGHSQGGLVSRWWMHRMGGADKVHHLISLSSPHHGTEILGAFSNLFIGETGKKMADTALRSVWGQAGLDQTIGSDFLNDFLSEPDTLPGVHYSSYASKTDVIVVPHESSFLTDTGVPGANVHNAFVQDAGLGMLRHEEMPMNKKIHDLVLRTLVADLQGEDVDMDLANGSEAQGFLTPKD